MTTYPEEFVARLKDWAVMGLEPAQIATRMGLLGEDRRDFLYALTQKGHPLRLAYLEARGQHLDDLDSALENAAVSGDTDALDIAYREQRNRGYERLLNELFGI